MKFNEFLRKDNGLWLAPIHDYTNIVFRTFCILKGAQVTISEMSHIQDFELKSIPEPEEFLQGYNHYFGFQLVDYDIDSIIKYLKENKDKLKYIIDKANFINFNFGCPSKNIINNKEGSYFLKDTNKLRTYLIKAQELRTILNLPISIKIRTGYSKENLFSIINKTKDLVDFIIIHGRIYSQGYSGFANWDYMIDITKKFPECKFIFNGDVNIDNINQKLNDGHIMLSRYALNNPNLFGFEKNENPKSLILEYLELWDKLKNYYKVRIGTKITQEAYNKQFSFLYLKRIMMLFTKGIKNGAKIRTQISKIKNKKELKEKLNILFLDY